MNKPSKLISPVGPLIKILITCIFCGGFIGASTNAINGYVSPQYYQNILGWEFTSIWSASIAQGIFEGLIYGILFSLIFTISLLVIWKGQAPYSLALTHILKTVLVVYICWTLGGLIAMGLAALSPEFYRAAFYKVPTETKQMLRYAWVGGSIWGALLGGFIGVIVAIVWVNTGYKSL